MTYLDYLDNIKEVTTSDWYCLPGGASEFSI